MKKKTTRTFGIEIIIVMALGLLCKELTRIFIPFIEGGNTQYYTVIPYVLNLANVHHVNLPDISLHYTSAWGLVFQIMTLGTLYCISNKKYYNKRIATFIITLNTIFNLKLIAISKEISLIKDIATVLVIWGLYMLNLFENKWMKLFLGLYLGGSLGNFLEGNIRGYVTDMLWLLPKISDQVHNIEDMCIWIGLFGMAIGIVYYLVKFLIKLAKKDVKHAKI